MTRAGGRGVMAVNLAVLPVVAGLMAGTGAMAAYVVGPAMAPTAAVEVAGPKSCETQTWPYIDNRCVAAGGQQTRKVRLVMAPREATPADAAAADAKMDAPPAAEQLVTRDTVGRPDTVAPAAMPAVPGFQSHRERRRPRPPPA